MWISSLTRTLLAGAALGALTACGGGFSAAPNGAALSAGGRDWAPPPASEVYVSSTNNRRILGFPIGGFGNIAPNFEILGSKTMLTVPAALAITPAGEIYVANQNESVVLIFAPGAHGNAMPAVLGGSKVPLHRTLGIALDKADNIYVSDRAANQILIFAAGSTGNTPPIATIAGSSTLLSNPRGMAFDPSGDLFVAEGTPSAGAVLEFPPGANGNVAPIAVISGSATMLAGLISVSLDSTGRIVVPSNGNSVLIFSKGSNGNVAPAVVISGAKTKLSGHLSAGVGPVKDQIYVAECCVKGGSIEVFAKMANGNVPPIRSISGSKTQMYGLFYPSFH